MIPASTEVAFVFALITTLALLCLSAAVGRGLRRAGRRYPKPCRDDREAVS